MGRTMGHFPRVDTLEIKYRIQRKLGRTKADKYFNLLKKYLTLKITKSGFDKLCVGIIGRDNVRLHNHLFKSILRNAYNSSAPPAKATRLKGSLSTIVQNGRQNSTFPPSPRKGRTKNVRDCRSMDSTSPLGPHGKVPSKKQDQQSPTELLSLGSRPPGSVEDGEEVEQFAGSPGIHSRSPVKPPLGIPINNKGMRKNICSGVANSYHQTCHTSNELPDTGSLKKILEEKLARQGLNISVDCANLLNNSIDVFMKRLIKPCLELAASNSQLGPGQVFNSLNGGVWPVRDVEKPSGSASVSMLDLKVAMELNPLILGEDWPVQLEKICLRASE